MSGNKNKANAGPVLSESSEVVGSLAECVFPYDMAKSWLWSEGEGHVCTGHEWQEAAVALRLKQQEVESQTFEKGYSKYLTCTVCLAPCRH